MLSPMISQRSPSGFGFISSDRRATRALTERVSDHVRAFSPAGTFNNTN